MKKIVSLILCLLCLAGCGVSAPVSDSFESMDTFMQIELYGSREAADAVRQEILRLDSLFSAQDASSDIGRLNRDGAATVDEATHDLLGRAQEYSALLDNDLDLFVYPLVEAWGFISRDYRIPDRETIDRLLPDAQTASVRLTESPCAAELIGEAPQIDLGAVAKGYAADRAAAVARQNGAASGILNLGGTVAALGNKPGGGKWRVGIRDPENAAAYFGSVACADQYVATSGNYERYFERGGKRYCHIIDPQTGYPADSGVVSVTVISDSGLKSDALSTALFVKGADGAAKVWRERGDFDFILLDDAGNLYVTEGILPDFRLNSGYDYTVKTVKKER